MRRSHFAIAVAILTIEGLAASICLAIEPSKAQQVLAESAEQQKYTFLVFYREDNQATRTMAQTLQAGLGQRSDQASICYVSVSDPAEQALVKKFGVSRAPLPFTLAVAPNGAVTALISQKITDSQIASAFVTVGMADCMKAMQDRKLVLVCVHPSARSQTPAAALEFQSDPEFKDRISVISIQANDSSEAPFLKQMEIVPASLKGSTMVFLAPPAVLVGKFASHATKAEMAAALHKAGKCCDDPNCKHGHGPQANKAPGAKRN
jgi:hypothetical protein